MEQHLPQHVIIPNFREKTTVKCLFERRFNRQEDESRWMWCYKLQHKVVNFPHSKILQKKYLLRFNYYITLLSWSDNATKQKFPRHIRTPKYRYMTEILCLYDLRLKLQENNFSPLNHICKILWAKYHEQTLWMLGSSKAAPNCWSYCTFPKVLVPTPAPEHKGAGRTSHESCPLKLLVLFLGAFGATELPALLSRLEFVVKILMRTFGSFLS